MSETAYTPPQCGFRTFVIVWAAQSLAVIGSGMTGLPANCARARLTNLPAISHHQVEWLTKRSAQLLQRPHVAAGWARQQGTDRVERNLRLVG
jgi:hypothetical protein